MTVPKQNQAVLNDSEESDEDKNPEIPGEYDPKLYENLDIDSEGKVVLQYITK